MSGARNSQLHGASDVIYLRRASTTTTVLDQWDSKQYSSNYPYTHMLVQLSTLIKDFPYSK